MHPGSLSSSPSFYSIHAIGTQGLIGPGSHAEGKALASAPFLSSKCGIEIIELHVLKCISAKGNLKWINDMITELMANKGVIPAWAFEIKWNAAHALKKVFEEQLCKFEDIVARQAFLRESFTLMYSK